MRGILGSLSYNKLFFGLKSSQNMFWVLQHTFQRSQTSLRYIRNVSQAWDALFFDLSPKFIQNMVISAIKLAVYSSFSYQNCLYSSFTYKNWYIQLFSKFTVKWLSSIYHKHNKSFFGLSLHESESRHHLEAVSISHLVFFDM